MCRRVQICWLAFCLLAAVGYALSDDSSRWLIYNAVGFLAAIAFWVRPLFGVSRPREWNIPALALLAFVAGDTASTALTKAGHNGFPVLTDVFYVVAYLALVLALARLAGGSRGEALAAGLDAALVTAAGGLFIFLFWLEPLFAGNESLSNRSYLTAIPLLDLLLLALLALVLFRRRFYTAAHRLLVSSLLVLIISDLAYSFMMARSGSDVRPFATGAGLIAYALFGAGVLHPNMGTLPQARTRNPGLSWLMLPGVCLLAPPIAGGIQFLNRGRIESGKLLVASALIGVLGFARLIQLALARRASERHYRSLIENVNDVIALVSLDGTVVYVSPSVERMLGCPISAYLGRPAFELVHPDERRRLLLTMARLGDRTAELEARILAGNGGYRRTRAVVKRLGSGPNAGALLVTAHDVTARREIEAELVEKDEQLRQAQKMEAIGQLAGGVAHDFNNLLTAINGYGEFVLSRAAESDPELQADVEQMLSAGKRAGELVRQLLAFSRRQVMRSHPLDLNVLVSELDRLLRRLIGEYIELVTLFASEPAWIEGDETQIEQAVINLAVNARDAMPDGGVLTLEVATDDEHVTLTVSDTGCGMDEQTRRRAFEPFFTTKPHDVGTGLGLSTVYGIVAQSGGEITLLSAPNVGTSFVIELPRIAGPEAALVADNVVGREAGSGTVLVVEDEEMVRKTVVRALSEAGFVVREATEGEEGLRVLERGGERVDVLVSDIVMPRMSGVELAQHALTFDPQLAVVLMSGYARNAFERKGALSAAMFLAKPFTASQLLAAVRTAMDDAGGGLRRTA